MRDGISVGGSGGVVGRTTGAHEAAGTSVAVLVGAASPTREDGFAVSRIVAFVACVLVASAVGVSVGGNVGVCVGLGRSVAVGVGGTVVCVAG